MFVSAARMTELCGFTEAPIWHMCAGAVQLGSVGVALSVFGSATKLMNVPLLSVTTQIVATAVGSNEGALSPCHQLSSVLSVSTPA